MQRALPGILIGGVAGIVVVFAIVFIDRIKLDDPVGAISVHGICGVWGTLAVGLFSTNPEHTFGIQLIGTVSIAAFAFLGSLALLLPIKAVMGLRVSEEEEDEGLDVAEHGQPSYADFQPIMN